jgi:allantoicase
MVDQVSTGILAQDVSIEKLRGLYASGTPPEAVIEALYARTLAYHDKAVWITLAPKHEVLNRTRHLTEKYPDLATRYVLLLSLSR